MLTRSRCCPPLGWRRSSRPGNGPGACATEFRCFDLCYWCAGRWIEVTMSTVEDVQGPVSRAIGERAPFGPMERVDHDRLAAEQQESLAAPRRSYSISARLLFSIMDLL